MSEEQRPLHLQASYSGNFILLKKRLVSRAAVQAPKVPTDLDVDTSIDACLSAKH